MISPISHTATNGTDISIANTGVACWLFDLRIKFELVNFNDRNDTQFHFVYLTKNEDR